MRLPAVIAAAFAAALIPAVAGAQGTLAASGLGYPPGGLSSRSQGAAGSTAEIDPASTLNPAALAQSGTFEVYAQGTVERRRTEVEDPSTTSVIPSFPVAGMSMPIGRRWMIGISLSSMLDRTWGTTSETELVLDGTPVTARDRATSEGGMTDIRVGTAYRLGNRAAIGLAAHVITGENRLELSRSFVDAPQFGTYSQSNLVDYFGSAVSAGVLYSPVERLTLGASARIGGNVGARVADSVVASATIPTRLGGSLQYSFPGAAVAARVGYTQWSDFSGFSERGGPTASTLDPQDGWEYALGAELDGPSAFGPPTVLRVGIGRRDLPFRIEGNSVTENQVTGGIGIPLAGGRALLDFSIVRASRSGVSGVSEKGWITSLGLLLRP
jgi:long-subunit fatty acid transport protein